jgi:predicted ArsR family transcriptional regulator
MLLDELKERFPAETVTELFNSVVSRIYQEHKHQLRGLSLEERLNYLVWLLEDEGFLASWESTKEGYNLIEYSCPYYSIGQKHSEVCTFDKQLMVRILGTEIDQHSCMLRGDSCCQFTLALEPNSTVNLM